MPEQSTHDRIVIGASAGGVEALIQLVRDLPADLPAALFIVLHLPSSGTSAMPAILTRSGVLPAVHPTDGEPILNGRIYVAPPDYHLLLHPGSVRLSRGSKENRHRPSVDPLFRTAARVYNRRVIGVVLTGTLDDGTAGLHAIKMRGGLAVVQDPEDALYPGMPRSAIENVEVDYVLPLDRIAPLLVQLAHEPVREMEAVVSDEIEFESEMAEFNLNAIEDEDRPGTPSHFACPTCGGILWEIQDGRLTRYRCRVGHAFSVQSLMAEQSDGLEEALWTALRALEERAALARRMAAHSVERNHRLSATRFEAQAGEDEHRAKLVREALTKGAAILSDGD